MADLEKSQQEQVCIVIGQVTSKKSQDCGVFEKKILKECKGKLIYYYQET